MSSFLPLLWHTFFQILFLTTSGVVYNPSSDSLPSSSFCLWGQPLNPHLLQPIFSFPPHNRQCCKCPLCKCGGEVLHVGWNEEIVEKITQSWILTDSARLAWGRQSCKFFLQQCDNLLATLSSSGFSLTATGRQTTGELISSHRVCAAGPSQL